MPFKDPARKREYDCTYHRRYDPAHKTEDARRHRAHRERDREIWKRCRKQKIEKRQAEERQTKIISGQVYRKKNPYF